ncbi:MAG: PHP domain-containing protein, partial [Rubritepida sp.]|nr:PHP domain-containing protein [Rubritepida sp.]
MAESFIHLHAHSSYSLSEGAIKAEKLAELARTAGMPAVALTDTANLFGALEFAQACTAQGVQPIMGCQLWLARSATDPRPEAARLQPDVLVALAMDARGLENLQQLSSAGYLGEDPSGRPAIGLETLERHSAGIFLLTGGTHGPIARLLAEGRRPQAVGLLTRLADAFPARIAVELHRHATERDAATEPGQLALRDAAGLPIAATN